MNIDIQSRLPDTVRLIAVVGLVWCPYDENRLLVDCATKIDTGVGLARGVSAYNSYILDLTDGKAIRATPSVFPLYGGPSYDSKWLPGSNAGADSFTVISNNGGYYLYILQENLTIDVPQEIKSILYSPKGKQILSYIHPNQSPFPHLAINGKEIFLPDGNLPINQISWSPDEKKIALSVNQSPPTYSEIWIIDLEKYMREQPAIASVNVINFRRSFCMYNFHGVFAEFITNSTLAVSMHKDGDDGSPLWEITEDGQKVRQLTFMP